MSQAANHVPLPSCSNGMSAFDGGSFDLARHEVWAVCRNPGCRVENCFGRFAAEYGDSVFRVRNRRDLKAHLCADGTDLDATTPVLVVPKGQLRGRPTAEQIVNGAGLAVPADPSLLAATGNISVRQARRINRFPLTATAVDTITELCARPIEPKLAQTPEVAQALRNRNQNHLESLVVRHGIHRVQRAVGDHLKPSPDGNVPSLGLAADLATVTLADRDGTSRLARAYAKKGTQHGRQASTFVDIIPSAHLVQLDPRPGQGVGGRLQVAVGGYTPHAALRILDRVHGKLDAATLRAVRDGQPLDRGVLADVRTLKADIPVLLNTLLNEGVFSSGLKDAPIPDAKKRLLESINGRNGYQLSRPALHSDQVSITCPHPASADHVLHLIGQVGGPVVNRTTGQRAQQFTLITVIALPRDGDLLAETTLQQAQTSRKPVSPHRRNRRDENAADRVRHTYSSLTHLVGGVADGMDPGEEAQLITALGLDRS